MKRIQYRTAVLTVILSISVLFSACGNAAKADDNNAENDNAKLETAKDDIDVISANVSESAFVGTTIDASTAFSDRDLSGAYEVSDCEKITLSDAGSSSYAKGVSIDGSTITITKEGDYILNGSLRDGMVIVDVDKTEKVQLVLNGVDICSASSAAIYIKQADKVFITLADDTKNLLSNGGEFVPIDDNNIDAVIFSKEDLTLNGTGNLTITSPVGHGVVSKDDLVVTGGNYNITASSHGFAGKDSVAVAGGNFDIQAGKDGIHSANDDDTEKGWVYIENGTFALNVESDGISAVNEIFIAGGDIAINKSYEGLEARIINITGGKIAVTSEDDGLNATDKRNTSTDNNIRTEPSEMELLNMKSDNTGDNFFRRGGKMAGDTQQGANINISGGVIYINAEGDGIDSNGYLTVSGGEIYVTGPSNGGNGALDYGIEASISGGVVVAAGQSGMAQNFGSDSTQCAMLINLDKQQKAGTDIVLLDSNRTELVAWTMEKAYNSVVISCPGIVEGGSYTVKMGDTETEVTTEGTIYGEGGGFGQHGGRPNFKNGEKPEGAPNFGNGERPKGAPDLGNGERPEGAPDLGNGERPEGAPDLGNGERPEGAPDLGNGERPEGAPDLGNGGRPEGATDLENGERPEGASDLGNGEKPEAASDAENGEKPE